MIDILKPLVAVALAALAIASVAAEAAASPEKPNPAVPCGGKRVSGFTLAQYIPYPRTCCRTENGRRVCYQC